MGATRRDRWAGIALLAGSVAVFLAAAEVVSRVAERFRPPAHAIRQYAPSHFAHHRFLEDDPLGWELLPAPPVHNALGMKDVEYPAAKGPGVFRVLVLGDSVAYGMGVETAETFENQLEMRLARRYPGRRIEILNMGVPGYNTRQELLKLRRDGLRLAPDLVLVAYTMNDDAVSPVVSVTGDLVRFEFRLGGDPEIDPSAYAAWAQRAWSFTFLHSSFARYLSYAVLRIRLSGKGQDEAQEPPGSIRASREALLAIRDEAAKAGAKAAVAVFPVLDWQGYDYRLGLRHARLTAFLDGAGIPSLELLSALRVRPGAEYRIAPDDDFHPNRLGHTVAAAALLPFLEERGLLGAPPPAGPPAAAAPTRAQEIFAGRRPSLHAAAPGAIAAVTALVGAENLHVLVDAAGPPDRALDYTLWLDDHADPLVQLHVEGGTEGAVQVHQHGRMVGRITGAVDYGDGMLIAVPRRLLPGGVAAAEKLWIGEVEAVDHRGGGTTVHGRITGAAEAYRDPRVR